MDNNIDKSAFFWRMVSTSVIWALALVIMLMGFIFLPAFSEDVTIVFFGIVGILVFCSMGFVWDWGSGAKNAQSAIQTGQATQGSELSQAMDSEKRKRDRLDAVIQTLSDDQLMVLRERLASGEVTDEQISRMLGQDDDLTRGHY